MFRKSINVESEIVRLSKSNSSLESQVKSLRNELRVYKSKTDTLVAKYIENASERQKSRLFRFERRLSSKYLLSLKTIFKYLGNVPLLRDSLPKDFGNFKGHILQPFLEEQWKQDENEEYINTTLKLKNKAQKIVKRHKELKTEFLRLEREKKPTDIVSAKLQVLGDIIDV